MTTAPPHPRPTWAEHALNIALASAMRSEDPYCQVGATVLSPKGIVLGVGYNGTVAGIDIDWTDRDGRRPYSIHAEANALRYVTPHTATGGLLATSHFPCSACVLLAASYGITEIVWLYPPDWERYPAELTKSIAARLGVRLVRIAP